MAPKPQPYRAANGHVSWFVRFRVDGKANPVKETFSDPEDPSGEQAQREAEKFARLVDRVGGTAARATRRTGEDSAREMPTLRTWFDTSTSNDRRNPRRNDRPPHRLQHQYR